MVDDTAEELNRDLGAGLEPPPRPVADDRDDLVRRIEALERRAFRQEQVFNRVLDLLESNAAGSGMTGIRNAMTVDVEDYFQVQAFAHCIDRKDWDAFPRRVDLNTNRILDHFRRPWREGDVLHPGVGGGAVSRPDPPHRRGWA